jgi:hypothetical protein
VNAPTARAMPPRRTMARRMRLTSSPNLNDQDELIIEFVSYGGTLIAPGQRPQRSAMATACQHA